MPFAAGNCPLFDYPGNHQLQILQDWVAVAITDSDLLVGAVLLATCRFILRSNPDNLVVSTLAIQYQQNSLHALRQSLANDSTPITPLAIGKALALMVDAVSTISRCGRVYRPVVNSQTLCRQV